jgi:hypothetical protein
VTRTTFPRLRCGHGSGPKDRSRLNAQLPKPNPWPHALIITAVSLATSVALVEQAPPSITTTLAMALLTAIAQVTAKKK